MPRFRALFTDQYARAPCPPGPYRLILFLLLCLTFTGRPLALAPRATSTPCATDVGTTFQRSAVHNLTAGPLGVLVGFQTTLLVAAVLFAAIASHRRRQAEAANLKLTHELEQRRRADEEVNKLNAKLELQVAERTGLLDAANKELEAFSYSVAHDLRAPLRHINGFSKILKDNYSASLDHTAQGYLGFVCDGAKNMGQLMDDLLKMGRIGRQELVRTPTDLNSLVGEALKNLQPEYEGRQIDWRIGELPAVECDAV